MQTMIRNILRTSSIHLRRGFVESYIDCCANTFPNKFGGVAKMSSIVNLYTASHGRPRFAFNETLSEKMSTVTAKFSPFTIHARSGARMNAQAVAMIGRSIDSNAGSKHVVGTLLGDNNFSNGCNPVHEVQSVLHCHELIASKVQATPK